VTYQPSYYRLENASNVWYRFDKENKRKRYYFQIKILLIRAFTKSDISDSLRTDKIIEKPIHWENLIEEVQKLITVID
jgi:hypothetical protein